jgi:hypothetical protein
MEGYYKINIGNIEPRNIPNSIDTFYKVNSNPVELFANNCFITKAQFNAINAKLTNMSKRIYKMCIYGIRNKDYFIDKSVEMPFIFYEVHRNNTFYYSETYELIQHSYYERGNQVIRVFDKRNIKTDNFPILKDYEYESEQYNCIEYLVNSGEKIVTISYGDNYMVEIVKKGGKEDITDDIYNRYLKSCF